MNPLNQKLYPEQSRSNREANSSLRRYSSVSESAKLLFFQPHDFLKMFKL